MLIKSGYNFENNKCYDFTQHISSVYFLSIVFIIMFTAVSHISSNEKKIQKEIFM